MKKMNFVTAAIIILSLVFISCDDDEDNKKDLSYGPEVEVGNGKARAFIKLNDEGLPAEIGFTFSEGALENLPHDEEHTSYLLTLPGEKTLTPYDHISFDWTPHGHEPATIYDKPHFDIHFYMVSQSVRSQIVPGQAMEVLPEQKFLPPTYFSSPGEGEPQMGKHWVDGTSPELNGGTFTKTFVYGSYNGEVVFHEPMITREFLLSKPTFTDNIAQPEAFKKSGRYPTQYSVKFDQERKEFTVSLLTFISK